MHNDTVLEYAQAPFIPARRTAGFAVQQFFGLIRVMLLEYRTNWFIFLLFGALMPLGMLFLFRYAGVSINPDSAVFLIGGNLTTGVVFGPTMMLIQKIGWGRENHTFDYWATLPIGKLTLVLALVGVSVLFAVPGVATIFVVGGAMFGMPLTHGLWLIPLVPLGALSLSGFGAFLGAFAKDGQTSGHYANLLTAVVIFLSPMMIPQSAMPAPLRWASYVMPTTYVADAFRAVLAGNFGTGLAVDIGLLTAFTGAFLILVHRKLNWQAS